MESPRKNLLTKKKKDGVDIMIIAGNVPPERLSITHTDIVEGVIQKQNFLSRFKELRG